MDVELEVQAVVDVVDMNVGEIMKLRPGDIIQLNSSWPRAGGALGRRETQVLSAKERRRTVIRSLSLLIHVTRP